MNARLFSFVGGDTGPWRVTRSSAIIGEPLRAVARVDVVSGAVAANATAWSLRGITSNERYVLREEKINSCPNSRGWGVQRPPVRR